MMSVMRIMELLFLLLFNQTLWTGCICRQMSFMVKGYIMGPLMAGEDVFDCA